MNTDRLVVGVLLAGLGVLLLLSQAGVVDAADVIAGWWPLIIVAVGASGLLRRSQGPGAAITVVVGLALLTATTGLLGWSTVWSLWPVVLIVAGVRILLHRGRQPALSPATADERVQAVAVLAGRKLRVDGRLFRQASLTALMGGIELDLRDTRMPAEGAFVDAVALFGGVEITVPDTWSVDVSGSALLGGIDDATRGVRGGPMLHVHATAAFGGVEVTSAPSRRPPADAVVDVPPAGLPRTRQSVTRPSTDDGGHPAAT